MAATQVSATYKYLFNNVQFYRYQVNLAEGLERYSHDDPHMIICLAGQIVIRGQYMQADVTLDPLQTPIILNANSWHEIEALENSSCFLQIF
jgi:mannose-6-phosphate isomerase class I